MDLSLNFGKLQLDFQTSKPFNKRFTFLASETLALHYGFIELRNCVARLFVSGPSVARKLTITFFLPLKKVP